jgi:hypothetical protein
VSLLRRFWEPNRGAIRLDGVDLCDVPLDALRRRIAIVQHDNSFFKTSIGEHIRLGNPDATDGEIGAVARAANVHAFIVGLPNGLYDHPQYYQCFILPELLEHANLPRPALTRDHESNGCANNSRAFYSRAD